MYGVWKLGQQGAGKQKGHEIRMEVEAEGLFGLWASVEYLRMPGRGYDGRGGGEPGRKVGEMSIRCTEYSVDNADGVSIDIRADIGLSDHIFFELNQDGHVILATLECLRDLVMAAEQLMAARKK